MKHIKSIVVATLLMTPALSSSLLGEEETGWVKTLDLTFNVTQSSYSDNWAGGEQGNMTWIAQANGIFEKQFSERFNNKNTIKGALSAMSAVGATNIPEALSWGWRVVSPGVPFMEGKAYSDNGVIKAIILLTDGDNAITNSFSSYGKPDNPQVKGNANSTLDTKTAQVCNNIKANHDSDSADTDILLYTIVFDVTSGTITNLMQNCATTPNKHYFNSPSAEDLDSAFQTIAASLNQLRLKE